jgi:NADPH-dependent curcumin reductase CurA
MLNEQWRLVARPKGRFEESDFRWVEGETPPLGDGQALVRTIYLSLDPTNRGWAAGDTYMPAVPLDSVMRGFALGRVEESRAPGLAPGDLVQGLLGWQRYAVVPASALTRLPPVPVPLSAHLGLLGHIGLTAWVGLLQIGQPRDGETLVVSAAAGAVGSLVGQIGKIKGMRVVGIAGTDEKCRWITGELGFDAAFNYKKRPVLAGLRRECPKGIDVYFDNVGGATLDAVLSLINRRARIVVCGLISQYNATAPEPGPRNLGKLLVQRARMEGFIVLDHLDQAEKAAADLVRWHLAGKLQYRLDVVDGLEKAPAAVNRLFDGSNTGKLVVRVSEEQAVAGC